MFISILFIRRCTFIFSGTYANNGNMTGGYRGPTNTGPSSSQQNYGNNLHSAPSSQQSFYGQTSQMPAQQQQIYHPAMTNNFQQMGQIPRQMTPTQPIDSRGYGQPPQHQMPLPNRS